MSTSVASAAPWSRQSTGSPGTDATSLSRSRGKKAVSKLANGSDASKKSLSPVPSSSTRSTRSRKNVSYDESNSPEFTEEPLPAVNPAYNPTSAKRRSPANNTAKHANGFPSSSSKVATSTHPRKSIELSPRRSEADLDEVIVARRSVTSSPTSTAANSKPITPDPEPVKAELPPSVQKIKLSYTPKRPASEEPDDVTNYDETPRVSPTPDEAMSGTFTGGDDPTLQVGDLTGGAPRRAPRKKRKWLKKGEVDPDDPIAVAKQKERFILLDKADELLEEQMEAVHNGTHPELLSLWSELESRKNKLLLQCELRNAGIEGEINKFHKHGIAQARENHAEQNEIILDEKRKELNRLRHQIKFEKTDHHKRNRYPVLREGRGMGGWPVHTQNLLSNGNERLVEFQIDGELCHRRDSPLLPESLSRAEAKADLALFKSLRRPRSPGASERRRVQGASAAGSSSRPAKSAEVPKHDPVPALKPYAPIPNSIQSVKVPLRQTPNHSPSTTPAPPSRRPSPLPSYMTVDTSYTIPKQSGPPLPPSARLASSVSKPSPPVPDAKQSVAPRSVSSSHSSSHAPPSRAAPQPVSQTSADGRINSSTAAAKPQASTQPQPPRSIDTRPLGTSTSSQQPASSSSSTIAEAQREQARKDDEEWERRKAYNNPKTNRLGALSVESLYRQAILRQGLRLYTPDPETEAKLRKLRRHPAYPLMPRIDPANGKVPIWQKEDALSKMTRNGIYIPRNHPDHPMNW